MDEVDIQQAALAQEAQRDAEMLRHSLLRAVDFGLEVQQFLDSRIGQKILRDAEVEEKELCKELWPLNAHVPEQCDRIVVIMARVNVLQHWQDQFAKYIIAGQHAERELEGHDG